MEISMENFSLTLTLNEVNVILRSLGQHPFVEIADLIGKIKQQAEAQLKIEAASATDNPAPAAV